LRYAPRVLREQFEMIYTLHPAWNALATKARWRAGQSVFIKGCLGGVGRSAVQIARMPGAGVVGSCSASRREEALALGVSELVDYRAFDITSYQRRFDAVFDTTSALSLSQCGAMLKRRGMSLHIAPTFAKLIGCLLPSRHHLVFGNPTPQCIVGVAEAMERGQLVPVIGRIVPLSEAISAVVELERTGLPKGKARDRSHAGGRHVLMLRAITQSPFTLAVPVMRLAGHPWSTTAKLIEKLSCILTLKASSSFSWPPDGFFPFWLPQSNGRSPGRPMSSSRSKMYLSFRRPAARDQTQSVNKACLPQNRSILGFFRSPWKAA
jgi:Zinc-binding dehydrogenase